MKKLYSLFIALFAIVTLSAQLTTQVVSPGVFKLTYGAANDYSFYNPGFGTQTFYVHTWILAADNSANISYEDAWSNSNVAMNWDAAAGAYVGTIDLNTKTFTNSNNTVAAGTTVQKVGIVFKNNQNGATNQSSDAYVNGPTTLPVLAVGDVKGIAKKSLFAEGKLYTAQKGNLTLEVYEFGGKLVKTMKVSANDSAIDLNLSKKGLYLVKIAGSNTEVVKFSY
ncbi:T9SS type A sorting domain-containing protein [uncultured Chryseobacterium sp.]|uniref:T9SS type A sorting domain-containing protein n=1 Tax=uncultured Chryseobacterium sp. TaxID=259322 RepID=UPI00260C23B5|nr:T9SS type A sorting domain-containing protein [uncultured Chryseobacterium sp.]